jgi:hypothetical protein
MRRWSPIPVLALLTMIAGGCGDDGSAPELTAGIAMVCDEIGRDTVRALVGPDPRMDERDLDRFETGCTFTGAEKVLRVDIWRAVAEGGNTLAQATGEIYRRERSRLRGPGAGSPTLPAAASVSGLGNEATVAYDVLGTGLRATVLVRRDPHVFMATYTVTVADTKTIGQADLGTARDGAERVARELLTRYTAG